MMTDKGQELLSVYLTQIDTLLPYAQDHSLWSIGNGCNLQAHACQLYSIGPCAALVMGKLHSYVTCTAIIRRLCAIWHSYYTLTLISLPGAACNILPHIGDKPAAGFHIEVQISCTSIPSTYRHHCTTLKTSRCSRALNLDVVSAAHAESPPRGS